jgi:hydrogenase maturation factor HypF (carbamoyltransferase family)
LVKRQSRNEFKGSNKEIFEKLAEELSKGKIIALKNTAGYLLMCDATNSEAVSELRKRKEDLQNLCCFFFWNFKNAGIFRNFRIANSALQIF